MLYLHNVIVTSNKRDKLLADAKKKKDECQKHYAKEKDSVLGWPKSSLGFSVTSFCKM